MLSPIAARLAGSPLAFIAYGAVGVAFWMQFTVVNPLKDQLFTKEQQAARLLSERDVLIEEERRRVASEAEALREAIRTREAQLELERDRTAHALGQLEDARRSVAAFRTRADEAARALEQARHESADPCRIEPVPDAYADGLRDLLNTVYFGAHAAGSIDFDNPLEFADEDDVGNTAAPVPD